MRVMMVGRGVISTLYGWAFAQAGHEVRYYVRPGRAAALGGKVEVDILDARTKSRGKPVRGSLPTECVESLDGLGECDLAILSVRHDQMRAGAEQLAKAPRPRLGVLFFNNLWEDPKSLSDLFEPGRSLWGFPVAGGAFQTDGSLVGSIMGTVHLEAGAAEAQQLRQEIAGLFDSVGVAQKERHDMRAWLWLHFVVNAVVVAEAAKHGEGIEDLLASGSQLSDVARLAREAIQVVYKRGVDPKSETGEATMGTAPAFIAGRVMKKVASNPAMRRMMVGGGDIGQAVDYPLLVLAEARRLGVECPRLSETEPALRALAGAAA